MKAVACRVHRLDARTTGTFEPDTAILAALEKLQPNEHFCVQFDREPFALYRVLSDYSNAYCTSEATGPVYEVAIWHCGAGPRVVSPFLIQLPDLRSRGRRRPDRCPLHVH